MTLRSVSRGVKLAAVAGLVGLPFVVPFGTLGTANLALTYALVALSLVVLTGWVGQISLAQAALVGLGAYSTGVVLRTAVDLLFPLTVLVAALVGAAVAALLGLVALRVRGLYLAVATLIFAWMAQGYLFNLPWLGGIGGSSIAKTKPLGEPGAIPFIDFTDRRTFYFVLLVIVGAAVMGAANLRDSKTGRAWFAVKGSEVAAASLGIDVTRAKLVAFAVSGFLAGLAGGLRMTHDSIASASSFTVERSLFFLAIAVVGGLTSIGGALASGALFASLEELFFRVEALAGLLLIVSAGMLAGVLLFFPAGLAGIPPRVRVLLSWALWFSWRGRINRSPYILVSLVSAVPLLSYQLLLDGNTLLLVSGLPLVLLAGYVSVVVAIKRAHDRGRTGSFILLLYVPLINLWPLAELVFLRGTAGDNRYGPDPLRPAPEPPTGEAPAEDKADEKPTDSEEETRRNRRAELSIVSLLGRLASVVFRSRAMRRIGEVARAIAILLGQATLRILLGKRKKLRRSPAPDALLAALQSAAEAEAIRQQAMHAATTLSYEPGTAKKVDLPPRAELEQVLTAKNVTVRFGGLTAVDSFDLEVRRGEIVGLIGPNGAGKTTLFNAISGLNEPTSGVIELYGRDVTSLSVHMRARIGVGRTFQVLQLFPQLTVFENLMVATHVRNPTEFFSHLAATRRAVRWEAMARSRVRQVIGLANLEEIADRRVSDLPFGILRLVELARALVIGAPFVMLDEPASGLDNAETDRFMDFLLWVRQSLSISVLLIEHDMRVAMGLADYLYVIDRGKQIAAGPPAEVQRNEAVIAAYLGAAPAQDDEGATAGKKVAKTGAKK